ncbi:pyridoxal phosphate-dependent aminotransferase [Thermophagus xiamenensis]|uniref:Aminotransferase n=1 Tax=Thermophagus xiamenensis TaxID=385682 RepID=A0A1I2B5W1_9BACT|nr:pyridoxal phosphate-dependent aminotransferase [Thermophagus xiamenensis]SFE51565.1 aspartate aminotransferase [Thermophagus xiamenensis]
MNNYLSNRLLRLAESETIAMSQRSRELQSKGVDIINLSVGEPDFPTPEHIKEAGKRAIDDNFTHYPPVPGIPELREAIVHKFKRDNNLEFQSSQIVVSTGGKQALANAIYSLVDVGDEVIVPAPYWVSYPAMVQLAGGTSVFIHAGIEQDFKITPQQLEAAISPKTKVLLLNSPCNPTGSVYSYEELKGLVEVLDKHPGVFVISDEIYEYINYEDKHFSIASFDELKDRVVIVNGVSKGYAMTGWRLGYVAAPKDIAKACSRLQGQYTSGTSTISQLAALAAINGPLDETYKMVEAFRRRRDLVLKLAMDIPGLKVNKPAGAFYLFPNVGAFLGKNFRGKTIRDSRDLSFFLLEEAHVATVSGTAFGSDNCIRFSYASDDDSLVEAMKRIKEGLSLLK